MSEAAARSFSPSTGRTAPGPYQLQKMKAVHKRIAEEVALGTSDVDIARKLGVTKQMVLYTRRSPIVQEYLGFIEDQIVAETLDIAAELRALSPYALRKIEMTMLDPSTEKKLATALAQDILDRAGHSAVKRTEGVVAHMTASDIEEIKKRAAASGVLARGNGSLRNGGTSSEAKPSEGEGGMVISINADEEVGDADNA